MPPQQPTEIQKQLEEHRDKANLFRRRANKYIDARDFDVANICSFYAAYHAMRYAILSDPIFDLTDEEIYRKASKRGLHRDSKYNTHHSGHDKSGRGIGQNQIIATLYPGRYRAYDDLHKLSIKARYVTDNKGEILPSASDAYYDACDIVNDALSGKISWKPKPSKK